jgi:ADP-ribose pyrophosphatase YjhB (NUDIX family)
VIHVTICGMTSLLDFQAKICWTACGCLIHDQKILLVKHKKLNMWLNPGGHLESNELPHQAAEREFREETGIKVRAIIDPQWQNSEASEYLPNPFATNLHWISRENYLSRTQGAAVASSTKAKWSRGCEQHLNFIFLVEPINARAMETTLDEKESTEINWFSHAELSRLDLHPNIQQEIEAAWRLDERMR